MTACMCAARGSCPAGYYLPCGAHTQALLLWWHTLFSVVCFRCPAAIRQYLCLSLLKNSASSIPAALQLSASIFLSLLQKFRSALKAEVGVFLPMIMLKVGGPQLTVECWDGPGT